MIEWLTLAISIVSLILTFIIEREKILCFLSDFKDWNARRIYIQKGKEIIAKLENQDISPDISSKEYSALPPGYKVIIFFSGVFTITVVFILRPASIWLGGMIGGLSCFLIPVILLSLIILFRRLVDRKTSLSLGLYFPGVIIFALGFTVYGLASSAAITSGVYMDYISFNPADFLYIVFIYSIVSVVFLAAMPK